MSNHKASRKLHPKKLKTPVEKPFCAYLHRYCTQSRLDGYLYCIRHILEDKTAPFRQCSFVCLSNRKRCANAVPKNDKRESLCPYHMEKAKMDRLPPPKECKTENFSAVLSRLESYCKDENHNKSLDADEEMTELYKTLHIAGNPDMEHFGSSYETHKTQIHETWLGASDESEDDLDLSEEDVLKHAGVYTYEEVVRIYKEKLLRLQVLHVDQLKCLKHMYSEKRRQYLHDLKTEKKTLSSIHDTPKNTKELKDMYDLLKVTKRYHSRSGQEAILWKKAASKKQSSSKSKERPKHHCPFMNNGRACGKPSVVLSIYCIDHILKDPQQLLFNRCAQSDCPKVAIPPNDTCILHFSMVTTTSEPEPPSSSPVPGPSGYQSHSAKDKLPGSDEYIDPEVEPFHSMDDIASLGLDVVAPGSLFGLNQFGEPGESTDSALSGDDLMDIQPMLIGARKPETFFPWEQR